MSESIGDRTSGGLPGLVEELLTKVEALRADVDRLKSHQSGTTTDGGQVPATKRTLPTEGDPVELAVLATWVESLQIRYAAAGDWLRPCWWRHGFVVEELAALRVGWLAVYNTSEPVDATAGIRWHDEAEKCRERVRRTISMGPGCSAISHKPDEPLTQDSRWGEELVALRDQSSADLELGPPRGGIE